MSEEGSVQIAHDRPSEETPGRMAENYNPFSDGSFSLDNWRDTRGPSLGAGFLRHAVNPSLDALGAAIRAAQGLKSPPPSYAYAPRHPF